MNKYKTFLLLPVFKNKKFCQNEIFNQKNFISRSFETRSLVQSLDASIIFEKIININIPKPSLLISEIVFFQNPDDLDFFCDHGMTSRSKSRLLNGSGVDLDKFSPTPLPDGPIFLCMSRLIESKGLLDYAKAAKIVKSQYPDSRFLLYGFPDNHEDSIDESEIITII